MPVRTQNQVASNSAKAPPRSRFRVGRTIAVLAVLALCSAPTLFLNLTRGSMDVVTLAVTSEPCGSWRKVTGPGLSGHGSLINAVVGLPSGDVWIFGRSSDAVPIFPIGGQYLYGQYLYSPLGGRRGHAVTVHWDGRE